jgi:hypothetical protein
MSVAEPSRSGHTAARLPKGRDLRGETSVPTTQGAT